MANYVHGKGAALAHGGKNITEWMTEGTGAIVADPADTSHWGSNSKTYIMGQNDATFSGSGLYDGSIGGIEEHFEAILAAEAAAETSIPITFGPEGFAVGAVAQMAIAKTTTYEVNPVISDVVKMSFEMQASGGMSVGDVRMFQTLTTTTAGASLDNAAASTNGALIHFHVFSNANSGNVTAVLQHSTNNSTWVDLVTLPVVSTGTLSAFRVGESTGAVNRYLRVQVTLAGTGAVSVLAAAVRK